MLTLIPKPHPRLLAALLLAPAIAWLDEPIDMNQDHSYCPTYVAINWKIANGMTRVNPATVVEIPFTSPVANWKYILYVRVEKVVQSEGRVARVRSLRP